MYTHPMKGHLKLVGDGGLQTSIFLKESKTLNWNFHYSGSLLASRFWDVMYVDVSINDCTGDYQGGD